MPTENQSTERRALTIKQFTEAYPVSRATAYNLIAKGHLKAVKVGTRTLIPIDAAETWFHALPGIYDVEAR